MDAGGRTQVGGMDGDAAMREVVGARIDRYVLLGELGAGGMGVVYAAHDPELDRKVALKLVLPRSDGTASSAGRPRLLREAQALARLSHPNVVAVHDVGTHGDRVWIAMELVAGQTLGAWAKAGQRGWPELLRVLTETARGVAAAHAAGVVHRDLKPDNVMIDGAGRVRVMDFGLAHGRAGEVGEATMPEVATVATDVAVARTLAVVTGVAETLVGREDSPAVAETLVASEGSPGVAETLAAGSALRVSLAESSAGSALALRLTRVGAIQGTPAYMAPEQWAGQEAGPAVDQFGWSVMAWELLYGAPPFAGDTLMVLAGNVVNGRRSPAPRGRRVPGWLRRVVERGLAREPGRRWSTMAELLAALERGRARARLRTGVMGLLAIAAVVAAVAGWRRHERAERIAGCEARGAEIAAVWNDEARAALRTAFAGTGLAYAAMSAERVIPWIDEKAAAWQQARRGACMRTEVEGSWDIETLGRAEWCLAERRMAIAAFVHAVVDADARVVQDAVRAAANLPAVGPCEDVDLLRRLPVPPARGWEAIATVKEELARAGSLAVAGRYEDSLALTRRARTRAAELEWPPLLALARYREGLRLDDTGAFRAAETTLSQAYFEAIRHGVWDVAAEAATNLIFTVGERLARHADARMWAEHAAVITVHASDPQGLREAKRLAMLGNVELAADRAGEARALHERAWAIRERALGERHPEVARGMVNLANVHIAIGEFSEARTLMQRGGELLAAVLGEEHPDVATALNNLGVIEYRLGDEEKALAIFERVLTLRERALGPDHLDVAMSLNNVAALTKDRPRAAGLLRRALEVKERALGSEHPSVAVSLNNLAGKLRVLGATAEAQALAERALVIRERALGPEDDAVAESALALALLHIDAGRASEALALLERAVAIYERHKGEQEGELDARFALAQQLVIAGKDRERARTEAGRARDGYRKQGEAGQATLAEIEAWLAAQPAKPRRAARAR